MAQEVSAVIKVLCDQLRGGTSVEYDDLLEMAAVEDLEKVLKNRDIFTVVQQNKSKKVLLTINIRCCTTPDCQESCCPNLHICKYELLGQCKRRRCNYGHNLESQHNSRVLCEHGLHDLSKDQLRVLLLQNDGCLLPNVCVSYNEGNDEFGNCPDKDDCTRLHICKRYLRGLCDFSAGCNKCHDFYEPHPWKTLEARGVPIQPVESLLLIYRNILTLKERKNARSKEHHKPENRAKGAEEALERKAEKDKVICLMSIKGKCKYGDKCWKVHVSTPYKWEVEVDGVWIDIPDNEAIERDYSDPAQIQSVSVDSEPVRYDTMMRGVHRVRRLSTVSSVMEPSFSHSTKWIWYWKNENNIWSNYGSVKQMHQQSITSEVLEQEYLQFLKDSTHDVVKFTVNGFGGKGFYELNFREMKQRNEQSGTEREVRRRPFFWRSRGPRAPNSSSHIGVPGFWDKTVITHSGFQRVLLDQSHKDYIKVQELFSQTMKDFSILAIERVQNKKLWGHFQMKREQITKANCNKRYKDSERLLFHSTSAGNVDAICRHNFDMSASGANATVYGKGIYFSRNAKYSHDSTDHWGKHCMFACRVLVGQYTKGESHYLQPPAKDAAGNLYDSCVNDVRQPTIYVVFKGPQVYPEYLITYEKSRFPNHINIVQTDDTNNLKVVLAPPKSELSIYPKPTLGLQSFSSLKESDQSLCTSPLCSSSDNLLITARPSLSDNTDQSGTLIICNSTLAIESLDFEKSLDPFSCSSDKVKLLDASPTCCLSETESKTAVSASDASLSGSLDSFNESSSKNSRQRFDVFDNACDVNQTASVISPRSPHKPFSNTSASTCTADEFLTSKSVQGSTLPSYAGLQSKPAQDVLPSAKIPALCHSHNQMSISSNRRIHAWLKQNQDFTTLRPQSSKQDSHKPTVHRELVTNFSHPLAKPSSTARARLHNLEASSAISHSAKQISVPYKTSSPSADSGSLSSPSVSFNETQPSDLSNAQARMREIERLRQEHVEKKEVSKQKNCVMM